MEGCFSEVLGVHFDHAHSPIMMPENARTRAATRAEVTTERISESGRWGSGVGDTGRQVPMGH